MQEHRVRMVEAHAKLRKELMDRDQRKLNAALEPMDTMKRHAIMRAVDGKTPQKAQFVVQRFADRLFTKWGKSYGEVLGWVRSRLSFAILRSTNRCVRGSRVKWRSGVGMEDGAGLALMIH